MSPSPDSAAPRRPRIVILENHAAFRQISMRNFVRHTVQSLSDFMDIRHVKPPAMAVRLLPAKLVKYAVYFDVYILGAIQVWLASLSADLVIAADHAYAPALCLVRRRKRTSFVHDLIAVRQARREIEGAPVVDWPGRVYQALVLRSLLRMSVLGANTDVQASQLKTLGFEGVTVVVGQMLSANRFARTEPTARHPRRYVLQVTSGSWLKNTSFLLNIYDDLLEEFGDALPDLVVAGETTAECLAAAPKATAMGKFRYFERPSDLELATLMRDAAALVMPSIEEGFGVPPLEALSMGTPLILGDSPVFRRIYGDAAAYIHVRDRAIARSQLASLLTTIPSDPPPAATGVLETYGPAAVESRTRAWIGEALRHAVRPERASFTTLA